MKDICERIVPNKKYFIYGTAELGKYCFSKLVDTYGDDIVAGFIETKGEKTTYLGKAVYTPQQARECLAEDVGVIITGRTEFYSMEQNCLAARFEKEDIVIVKDLAILIQKGYKEQVHTVAFWPEINDINRDLLAKIAWYIPDRIKVKLCSENTQLKEVVNENVEVIPCRIFDAALDGADYILIWDFSKRDDLYERYGDRVRVVDPNFYVNVDIINYGHLYYNSFSQDEKNEMISESKQLFQIFCEKQACKVANIFCSGPSISEMMDMDAEFFEGKLNVICNTMIKDRKLMAKIKPKVITYADSGFFISPCNYSLKFYSDLLEVYEEYHFTIFVPMVYRKLILQHYPQFEQSMVGIPSAYGTGYWFLDQKFAIKGLCNILTEYMVPVASSVCDVINLFGCTGREEGETYFWKHNTDTQYHDLMSTVFEMWPAFFHFQKYEEYYRKHCEHVELQMRHGESIGKRYNSLTTSFIPALKRRSIRNI